MNQELKKKEVAALKQKIAGRMEDLKYAEKEDRQSILNEIALDRRLLERIQ